MKKIDSDVIEKLQEPVEIPECVRAKADETLQKIREGECNRGKYTDREKKIVKGRFFRRKIRAASVLLAGCLAFGTISVGAAVFYEWNQRAAKQMQADEEQQQKLMEEGVAAGVKASDENNGVKVEAVQTIADYHYIYIWFQVKNENEDLNLPEYAGFKGIDVTIEGMKDVNFGMSSGTLEKISEDGTYELRTTINHDMKESMNGKTITASFKDLVEYDETLDTHAIMEGDWTLQWTLQASDKIQEISINKEIEGYDNVILEQINLTPISSTLYFADWKDRLETVEVQRDNGEIGTTEMYQNPPSLVGFLMKDGTVITDFKGGPGSSGLDEDGNTYMHSEGFGRVVDVENVKALLFLKKECLEEEIIIDESNIMDASIQVSIE